MKQVIHIYGGSGSGTSTLGKYICDQLGYFWMDTDDYFWMPTNPRFIQKREPAERIRLMKQDIEAHDNVVISGSLADWSNDLPSYFTLAIRLYTDTATRVERLRAREFERFGERILPGGDMYEGHQNFLTWAAKYETAGLEMRSEKTHDEWEKRLTCPLIKLDGSDSLEDNFQRMLFYQKYGCSNQNLALYPLRLVRPSIEHKEAALVFKQAFFDAGEKVIDGSELLDHMDSYEEWLSFVTDNTNPQTIRKKSVPTDTYFALDNQDKIVGIIDLRRELNDFFRDFGHSGYSVVPTERRKGYATLMLEIVKRRAVELGLNEIQLSALRSNIPSVRTIQKNGGELIRSFEFAGQMADVYIIHL